MGVGLNLQEIWNHRVRLADLSRGPIELDLEADEARRRDIARALEIPELKSLKARLRLRSWLDGAELSGQVDAHLVLQSGVSLELFDEQVRTAIEGRFVPAGSPHAPDETAEIELDPDLPDPPEVLAGEEIDVAAFVVEHLALSVDPFPRRPGETFDYSPPQDDDSPFAVLKRLKDDKQ